MKKLSEKIAWIKVNNGYMLHIKEDDLWVAVNQKIVKEIYNPEINKSPKWWQFWK